MPPRARAATALELSVLLLGANVLRDWLLSYFHPAYPLVAAFATGAAFVAGLVVMRRQVDLQRWRATAIAAAALLTAAGVLRLVPPELGVVPAVPALVVGLGVPWLRPQWLPRARATRRALAAAPLIVFAVTMLPLRTVHVTDASLLGLGLGWGKGGAAILDWGDVVAALSGSAAAHAAPEPVGLPFALVLAREQGLLGVLALGLVLAVAALVVLAVLEDPDASEVRRQIAAGAVAAMCLTLLGGSGERPPFLTSDSVAGTWALVAAVVSLALVAQPGRDAGMRRARVRGGLFAAVAVVAVAAALVVYERALEARVLPYAGTGAPPGYDEYVPLDGISTAMQDATVAFEDPAFREHPGIDWRGVHEALRYDLRAGRVVAGASTITQQLAKNLFLGPERTLGRKLREAALALAMERVLTKDRILELYLNTIDYGLGRRGIGAAARGYFGEAPAALTLGEGAVLAGLVPRPPRERLDLHEAAVGQRIAIVRVCHRFPDRYVFAEASDQADLAFARLAADGEGAASGAPAPAAPPASGWGPALGTGAPLAAGVALLLGGRRWRAAAAFGAAVAALVVLVARTAGPHWHPEPMLAPSLRSPNHDARPPDVAVSAIVLHATVQDSTWSAARAFLDFTAKVSAHFVVGRTGEVVQAVPLERRAWHAGVSALDGVDNVNDFSIGIELVNRNDGVEPYPDVQYVAAARLIDRIRARYPVPLDRIVTHAAIALPPGRKSDPLGFDLERLRGLLAPHPVGDTTVAAAIHPPPLAGADRNATNGAGN